LKKKIYISSDIKKIEIERKLEQCITIVKFSLDFDKKKPTTVYKNRGTPLHDDLTGFKFTGF
jgi:hypothetical protein